MKITIAAVGKIKEKYYVQAISEYMKRLGRYCVPEIVEVADEKTPEGASRAVYEHIKDVEGKRLLKSVKDNSYKIALAIEGSSKNSLEFAKTIDEIGIRGCGSITFFIGGSLGLSKEILDVCDEKISFSKMTFPHQLMRVILLEQIYRAYRIIKKEPYHK